MKVIFFFPAVLRKISPHSRSLYLTESGVCRCSEKVLAWIWGKNEKAEVLNLSGHLFMHIGLIFVSLHSFILEYCVTISLTNQAEFRVTQLCDSVYRSFLTYFSFRELVYFWVNRLFSRVAHL
ncbi:hypothetical protein XENOCAPTIV_008175 [Xenoophorus captivus]|uniref:Uncharacterized protein n=1 Tax=Xenoophorus captivus TaxID=1517983 RepID=A0ABV0QH59_9TELE